VFSHARFSTMLATAAFFDENGKDKIKA